MRGDGLNSVAETEFGEDVGDVCPYCRFACGARGQFSTAVRSELAHGRLGRLERPAIRLPLFAAGGSQMLYEAALYPPSMA